jgi:hypothetical protein
VAEVFWWIDEDEKFSNLDSAQGKIFSSKRRRKKIAKTKTALSGIP